MGLQLVMFDTVALPMYLTRVHHHAVPQITGFWQAAGRRGYSRQAHRVRNAGVDRPRALNAVPTWEMKTRSGPGHTADPGVRRSRAAPGCAGHWASSSSGRVTCCRSS